MAIADKFTKANNGVDAQPATLTSTLNPGGTTATLSTSTGWPQDSTHGPVHFTCFKADATAKNGMLAGSQAFFKATLTGTTLSNITRVGGSSVQAYANGDPAIVYFTPYWTNDLIDGLLVSHDQDGTLKAGAVDVAAVLANDVVETAKIKDKAVTLPKINGGTTAGVLTTDASGNVTVQGYSDFFCYLTNDWSPASAGENSIMASGLTKLWDTGSNVSATGVFTAPSAGVYSFSGSVYRDNNTDITTSFSAKMSGTTRIFYANQSTGTNSKRLPSAITLMLAAGDTVSLRVVYAAGTTFRGGVSNCWFSGTFVR